MVSCFWPSRAAMRPMASGRKPRGIAHGEDAVVAHHHQRKCAFDAPQRIGHGFGQGVLLGKRDQVNDDFGVAVGLKNRALALQPRAHLHGVDQVAVVRHGNRSFVRLHQNRLRIQQRRVSGGRVARVADGQRAAHFREHIFGEDVGHRAHGLVRARSQAIGSDDPRRFLPAMLQRVQPQVSQLLRLRMGEDRHHTALVMKFVGSQHLALSL